MNLDFHKQMIDDGKLLRGLFEKVPGILKRIEESPIVSGLLDEIVSLEADFFTLSGVPMTYTKLKKSKNEDERRAYEVFAPKHTEFQSHHKNFRSAVKNMIDGLETKFSSLEDTINHYIPGVQDPQVTGARSEIEKIAESYSYLLQNLQSKPKGRNHILKYDEFRQKASSIDQRYDWLVSSVEEGRYKSVEELDAVMKQIGLLKHEYSQLSRHYLPRIGRKKNLYSLRDKQDRLDRLYGLASLTRDVVGGKNEAREKQKPAEPLYEIKQPEQDKVEATVSEPVAVTAPIEEPAYVTASPDVSLPFKRPLGNFFHFPTYLDSIGIPQTKYFWEMKQIVSGKRGGSQWHERLEALDKHLEELPVFMSTQDVNYLEQFNHGLIEAMNRGMFNGLFSESTKYRQMCTNIVDNIRSLVDNYKPSLIKV